MAKQDNLLDQHMGEIADIIRDKLDNKFDSHEFIMALLKELPKVYGEFLIKHNNVARADAEISRWLSANTSELKIERILSPSSEAYVSKNILGNESSCAQWRKIG